MRRKKPIVQIPVQYLIIEAESLDALTLREQDTLERLLGKMNTWLADNGGDPNREFIIVPTDAPEAAQVAEIIEHGITNKNKTIAPDGFYLVDGITV
jgi:hypothetical protein